MLAKIVELFTRVGGGVQAWGMALTMRGRASSPPPPPLDDLMMAICDLVLINSLFDVARMLHDSIDYLTFEDERRQVTELICHLIDCVDYVKHFPSNPVLVERCPGKPDDDKAS